MPLSSELKNRFPLTQSQKAFIEQSRQTIRDILNGTDSRVLLIVGPCSIHDSIAAREFAAQLKKLDTFISSQFFIVMRAYCEKPRTTSGWKGFLYDPFLDGTDDIEEGLKQTRELLLHLADMQIPTAAEFLDPLTAPYYEDLVSWGSIGARTCSSQTHRQLASGLNLPMGIKNGIAGNISSAMNGVLSASQPHTYMGLNACGQPCIVKTAGNADAHIVLRGGEEGPNYDPASVEEALQILQQVQLPLKVLIDCSHGNSNKIAEKQPIVFQSVIHQIAEGNTSIRGLLLESHLFGGNQPLTKHLDQLKYGISITDTCLDWNTTKWLIEWGALHLTVNKNMEESIGALDSLHAICSFD